MQIREYIAENSIIEFIKQLEESEGYAAHGRSLGLWIGTSDQLWGDTYTDEKYGHLVINNMSHGDWTIDGFCLVLSGVVHGDFGYFSLTIEEL
jgi:hypothetical protein